MAPPFGLDARGLRCGPALAAATYPPPTRTRVRPTDDIRKVVPRVGTPPLGLACKLGQREPRHVEGNAVRGLELADGRE